MTNIVTSWNNDYPSSFARDRKGVLYIVNGLQRPQRWDGITAAAEDAGLTGPTAGPTVADDTTAGSVTASETYYCAYRFLDDELNPSNLSALTTVTTSAAASHRIDWNTIEAPAEARGFYTELYRSTASQLTDFYLVKRIGAVGTVTSITNDGGGNTRVTTGSAHNLVIGAKITVAGSDVGAYNTEHTVTSVPSTTTVDTNETYTSNGTGGTWTLTGYVDQDNGSDATLKLNTHLPILTSEGLLNARRFGLPPDFKSSIVSFQDRLWAWVDRDYTIGTVTTIASTKVVTGSGTEWTSEMVGRRMTIEGETTLFTIAAVGTATSLTLAENMATSVAGLSYTILPNPIYRNVLMYSEQDEPESFPFDDALEYVNLVPVQENTGDDDDATGLMAHGSALFLFKERHIYRMMFARQPSIDASVTLMANRGCINDRCHTIHEHVAYVMDQYGVYTVGAHTGSGVTPISGPIQNLWRDKTLDLADSSKKWFSAQADPVLELVRFYVRYTGDSGTRPKRALVYHVRSQQWWTESYPWEIGGACTCSVGGHTRTLVGAQADVVYKTHEGTQDNGTDITFTWRTGTFEFVEETNETDHDVRIVFEPVTGTSHILNSRIYVDADSSPTNYIAGSTEGGLTITSGSANAVVNMVKTQNAEDDISGYVRIPGFRGRTGALHRYNRFMSLELTGTQSSGDNLVIHSVEIRGVQ